METNKRNFESFTVHYSGFETMYDIITSIANHFVMSEFDFTRKTGINRAAFANWRSTAAKKVQPKTIEKIEAALPVKIYFDKAGKPLGWSITDKTAMSFIAATAVPETPEHAYKMLLQERFGNKTWAKLESAKKKLIEAAYHILEINLEKARADFENQLASINRTFQSDVLSSCLPDTRK